MVENVDIQGDYLVVVNDEEQYSIWPALRELPLGWAKAGPAGSRTACLEHIGNVWTDVRPLSLRAAIAGPEQIEPRTMELS